MGISVPQPSQSGGRLPQNKTLARPMRSLSAIDCEMASEDFGYGPPHAFKAGEVQEIHQALDQIDPEEIYEKADPSELSVLDVYPGIWDSETKKESVASSENISRNSKYSSNKRLNRAGL